MQYIMHVIHIIIIQPIDILADVDMSFQVLFVQYFFKAN